MVLAAGADDGRGPGGPAHLGEPEGGLPAVPLELVELALALGLLDDDGPLLEVELGLEPDVPLVDDEPDDVPVEPGDELLVPVDPLDG